MKLGVFTALFRDRSFEETCKYLSGLGVQTLELACGGTTGKHHTDPNTIMDHPEKIQEMKDIMAKYGLEAAAVSCHGNPVHPNPEEAKMYHDEFKGAILFAEAMGIDTIIGFSGCPGDSEGSKYPNWVTCAWPNDFGEILKYQWEIVIRYWKEMAEFAKAHGIKKIAFEMHPGFVVYNPKTLLKLREAVGDIIGANFDPSHLFWQGIDPVEAIKELRGAIYHFHAKDVYLDEAEIKKNGVLDPGSFGNLGERRWYFRSLGYGHDMLTWKKMMSTLRMVGYEGAVSIEHEDALMSTEEGLEKAVAVLKEAMMFENIKKDVFWA